MNEDLESKIIEVYTDTMKHVLLYAQAALPDSQYQAFRKLVLDEFGRNGVRRRIRTILERERNGLAQE